MAKITKKTVDGKTEEISVLVDIDNLTIGDLELLETPGSAKVFIDTLQKAVVGTDVRTLPLSALRSLAANIMESMREVGEAKN